jgi:hypothetical protein
VAATLRRNRIAMNEVFCLIDDKHVPLFRIVWISELPHFCGKENCMFEGRYEIRLDHQESLFASRDERDRCLEAIESWRRDED